MTYKKLFFAPNGREPRGIVQPKPGIARSGTKDVLTGADEPVYRKKRGKRNGKKGNFEEFRMSPESDSFFDIARSVGDNHTTLSQYIIDVMKLFKRVDTCSIYLSYKIAGSDENKWEKTILRHRLTIKLMEDGIFKTSSINSEHTITRRTQNELIAFIEHKPTVYNFKKGFKLMFRNLQRGNRRYDSESHARRPGKDEMVAHIPILYRNKPIGLLAIGGDLNIALEDGGSRIVSAIKEKIEKISHFTNEHLEEVGNLPEVHATIGQIRQHIRDLQRAVPDLIDESTEQTKRAAARACAMGIAIGTVLGEKLMTKFGGVTELTGKQDFTIDLVDDLNKLEDGKIKTLYVFMIDLDHFKITNDTYGHLKGDILLRKVADILKESVRTKIKKPVQEQIKENDNAENKAKCSDEEKNQPPKRRAIENKEQKEIDSDNVFRWGGEEFTILLPDIDFELALVIAKRIIQTISEIRIPLDPEADLVKVDGHWIAARPGEEIKTTCSIGAVEVSAVLEGRKFRTVKTRAGYIVETADNLMYRAKEEGRNRIYFAKMLDGKLVVAEYKNGSS